MKKIIAVLLGMAFCLCSGCSTQVQQEPQKVLLCCDACSMNDDAMALSMLLKLDKHDEVELLGVVLDGGTDFIKASYPSYYGVRTGSFDAITEFLKTVGRKDIQVHKGTDYPLYYEEGNLDAREQMLRTYATIFDNTEDRIILNDKTGALWHFDDYSGVLVDSDDGASFLIDEILENPHEVTVICIGPVISLAKAVKTDPSIISKAKSVYVMGGAVGDLTDTTLENGTVVQAIPGANTTNYAEYNVLYDPDSFEIVIEAGFKNLVVTTGTCVEQTPSDLYERLAAVAGERLDTTMKVWMNYFESYLKSDTYYGPLTVYALMSPDAVTEQSEGYLMQVTDTDSECYGETLYLSEETFAVLSSSEKAKCGKATVITAMDGFWDYTVNLLSR